MNIKPLLAAALLSLVTLSANAGVKKIGTLNGCDVYRIKSLGVFCPSTSVTVVADPKKPGTIEGVLVNASGTSVLGTVAAPAAAAGAAYLHRPDTTTVSQSGGGANAGAISGSTSAVSNNNNNVNSNANTASGGGTQNGSIHHNN